MADNFIPLFPPYERDDAFDALAELVQSSRPPLVLIGAGASVDSGYPSWPKLLEILRDVALRENKRDWRRSIDDISDAPWTAEIFANSLPKGKLSALIRRQFGSRNKLAEPHLSLACMPFKHYLTTNYDPSIEEALEAAGREHDVIVWPEPSDRSSDPDSQALSNFLINLGNGNLRPRVIYLHGRYNSPERRIVLTETDYVARYIASDDARRKLMAIFLTHPVLFVGFSMTDPDLANLMREVTARLRTPTPCHYALMSYKTETDRKAIRARMVGKFGVRPVFFSRTPVKDGAGDYSNLVLLLDALAGRALRPRHDLHLASATTFNPDDPHKGQFGGQSIAHGRKLFATKVKGSQEAGVLHLLLQVQALSGAPPLSGTVLFHLHPSFRNDTVSALVENGTASIKRSAWGAFTVGVIADGGRTRLELDLAEDSKLPLWFRRQ